LLFSLWTSGYFCPHGHHNSHTYLFHTSAFQVQHNQPTGACFSDGESWISEMLRAGLIGLSKRVQEQGLDGKSTTS
jgi:hypothetical protein